MTIEDVIKKETNVKGISLRSIRSGEIIDYYKKASDMPKDKIFQATPGYINSYGYLTIDVHF
mgnify:CR=1 FL=1